LTKFKIPVHFYALTAMVFWGMSFIWSSLLLKYYQPITIIFFRLIFSSFFLFIIIRFFWKSERINKKDIPLIILSAFFNPFFYFLGENYGLKFSSPTIASVIIATIPILSPLVAYLLVREKLAFINFVGIAISFGGVVIMLFQKGTTIQTNLLGILFLFGAVLSALFYSVILKKLILKYSALVLIAYQNLIGIFLFLPLFVAFEARSFTLIRLNFEIITSFLALAVLASSLSFVFFAHSVKLLGINKTNIFSNMIPVFTAFFSFIFSLEFFTFQKIIGIVLVIGGVYLSERTRRKF
jgi:drug/metabolite transporter (DMT)-like permease